MPSFGHTTYAGVTYAGALYAGTPPAPTPPPPTASWTRSRGWSATTSVGVPTVVTGAVGYEVNGRTRGWSAVATVSVDPATVVHYLPTDSLTYDPPVLISGRPYADADKNPWMPTSETHGLWGAYNIVIAGKNVTTFRLDDEGNPVVTLIDKMTEKDPGGDDTCDLIFPSITSYDTIAAGELAWLYADAVVTIHKLHPDGHTLTTAFEGVVGPLEDSMRDPSPGQIQSRQTVHCLGLWTRLDDFITLPRPSNDQYISPIPIGPKTPIDSAQFIYSHVHRAQIYGWPGKMARPANVGIPTGEIGSYGDPIASRTIQDALAQMQTATVVYTAKVIPPRTFKIRPRVWSSHVDFSLWCGQRGVTHNLTLDPTQAINAFYGHGQAPWGKVDPLTGQPPALADWHGWVYPVAIPSIPAYPLGLGVSFHPGDGHTGFQPFSDELRAHGFPTLRSQNTYLAGDESLIRRFQDDSGLAVDGIVGGQTWNQAFQTGINTKALATAYINTIVTSRINQPYLLNARGGIVGPNPAFDPVRFPRREKMEQVGSITRAQAVSSFEQEYDRIHTPYYTGVVTAKNIDPPEMPALDTLSGMSMVLHGHKGHNRKLYIAQVEKIPGMDAINAQDRTVSWTVSEQPDGMMTLAARIARDLGIKDLVASNRPPRRGAKRIPDFPIFDAEAGAGIQNPGQVQTAGLWNKYLIAMGAQVDVAAVKILADTPTTMAAAMFANPYLQVDDLIALPGLANPSVGSVDPWARNADALLGMGVCWATGAPGAMQGYFPHDPSGAVTGTLFDGSPWPFRANGVYGALFVWTHVNCHVSGDPTANYRVIFPQATS